MKTVCAIAMLGLGMGCTAPAPEVPTATPETETPTRAALPRELPEPLYALAFDVTMARDLADGCGAGVSMNEGLTDTVVQQTARELSIEGYTTLDLQRLRESLPAGRIAEDRTAYYQSNAITANNPDSFCTAARREAAARSGIGRFLAVRA